MTDNGAAVQAIVNALHSHWYTDGLAVLMIMVIIWGIAGLIMELFLADPRLDLTERIEMENLTACEPKDEEPVDLRTHIRTILHRWKLLLVLLMTGAAMGVIWSLIQPSIYDATAVIAISPPRHILALDGGGDMTPLPVRALSEFALSDALVSSLLRELKSGTLTTLRSSLKVTAASDPALQRLTVRDTDAQRAAMVVNLWAKTIISEARRLYGQDVSSLDAYTSQLTTSKAALDSAEEALWTFKLNNQIASSESELDTQQSVLTDYLNRAHKADLLIDDAQALREHLVSLDPQASPGFADDVSILMLAAQIFSGPGDTLQGQSFPNPSITGLQLQLNSGQPAYPTIAAQIAAVDDLLVAFHTRINESKAHLRILAPEATAFQINLSKTTNQLSGLTQSLEFARTRYMSDLAMAPKIEQAKIAAQDMNDVVRSISPAEAPTATLNWSLGLTAAVGAAVGLALSIILLLVGEWWRVDNPKPKYPKGDTYP